MSVKFQVPQTQSIVVGYSFWGNVEVGRLDGQEYHSPMADNTLPHCFEALSSLLYFSLHHLIMVSSAQTGSLSAWQVLQALGTLKRMVSDGLGTQNV